MAVYPVRTLTEVVEFINGTRLIDPVRSDLHFEHQESQHRKFSDRPGRENRVHFSYAYSERQTLEASLDKIHWSLHRQHGLACQAFLADAFLRRILEAKCPSLNGTAY